MGAVPVCAGCPGFCFCSLGRPPKRVAENDGPACKKADINGRNAHGTASGPPLVP